MPPRSFTAAVETSAASAARAGTPAGPARAALDERIDPTPEAVRRLYARLERTLAGVRARLDRPLTLAEKLLFAHLDDGALPHVAELRRGASYVSLRPDRVVLQDVLAQTAMLQFMQTGRARTAIPTTIHCDHLVQARVAAEPDLRESLAQNGEVYGFLRSAAARYGAGFWAPGGGIMHQVVLERYAFPGQLILGTDSHTPNAGGLGACAIGVGGADAVEAMACLPWEVLFPRVIGVRLTGSLSGWAAPKDVILKLAAALTVAGGTNAVLEYFGPGTASISATGKATIANMGAELGATTSVFPFDARMATYLSATGRGALAALAHEHGALLAADPETAASPASPHAGYDRVVEIDLSALEPHVSGPGSPDRVRPISALAAEVRAAGAAGKATSSGGARQAQAPVDAISSALVGSCTNSSYEDMSRAGDVARQALAHGVRASVPLLVTPGSEQVRATLDRDGQLAALRALGGIVLANACGPCIGQWRRDDATAGMPNTIVTSYNRNFPMRNDGRETTMNLIASPEVVTALALAGRLSFNPLTDSLAGADGQPFRLQPPAPAPEVPPGGFDAGRSGYLAPPADGAGVELAIDPASERLQRLAPWPAWDGRDFHDLPVLMKTRGKTTTDHISAAGPWLRYRGHLEHFSENFLMGATNAFTGERGRGANVLTGERGQAIAAIARQYRARGRRWVVVGDHNYGEGSSREHAALSPRLLGGAAVIARSFARIHETNLKKQGLLALTFADPDDYERLREDDLLSLLDLARLAPGRPVACLLRHADGSAETLRLNHSYAAAQVEWFKRGSALNCLQGSAVR
jgi:aconitate hydratase